MSVNSKKLMELTHIPLLKLYVLCVCYSEVIVGGEVVSIIMSYVYVVEYLFIFVYLLA